MSQPPKKPKPKAQSKATPPIKTGFTPYIPASTYLPEITLKGVLLGIILAMVLAGANAYLGLKMGQTVSASIPAAVISMTILRMFRQSNILENNIVQTIASAGEVVAAGMIFTIPALVMMGFWQEFGFWQIFMISVVGGALGILFSIPLRRALIVEEGLTFPEGVATAEVLKAGDSKVKGASGAAFLLIGGVSSAIIKFCQTGLQVLGESISGWFSVGGTVVGFSNGYSLALVGAGYIVGTTVAVSFVVGGVIAWLIGLPLYTYFSNGPQDFGLPLDASAQDIAMAVRSTKLRFIGVGVMMLGGIWTLINLVKPIKNAIKSSLEALKIARDGGDAAIVRTEHDIPMTTVIMGIIGFAVPIWIMYNHILSAANLPISSGLFWMTLAAMTLISLVVGFVCAAIGGYMSGIVGSSANPTSGITIGAILAISLSLIAILGSEIEFGVNTPQALSMAAIVIMMAGVMAVASSLSCDNLQDLKSGHILGATPWKQQVTLLIGVIAGAIVIGPVLQLLYEAYGIGEAFPRPGMDPLQALSAPQAALMESVANGIFSNTLELPLVLIGFGIGIAIIILDKLILGRAGSPIRLSVMAIALGIYLPMDIIGPFVLGGLVQYLAKRNVASRKKSLGKAFDETVARVERQGLLLAAGMIAGDALVGILLAIPFAAYQSTSVLAVVGPTFHETATILGTMVMLAYLYYMYRVATVEKGRK